MYLYFTVRCLSSKEDIQGAKKCLWIRPVQKVFPFKFIFPLLGWFCLKQVVIGLKFLYEQDQVVPSSCGNCSMMHTPSSIEISKLPPAGLQCRFPGRVQKPLHRGKTFRLSVTWIWSWFSGSVKRTFQAFDPYGRSRYSRSKIALPFNLTTILTSMFWKWFVAATFWALEAGAKAKHFRKGSSFFRFWTFFFDLVVWRDLPIFFAS